METGKVSVIQLPRSHNYVILRSKATKNPQPSWFLNPIITESDESTERVPQFSI